jgi:hypothetical protein
VIDDKTSIMDIRESYKSNQRIFNRWERVKIENIDLSMLGGKHNKAKLESAI